MRALTGFRREQGHWQARRAAQARSAFESELRHGLLSVLAQAPVRARIDALGAQVAAGEVTPDAAAAALLADLRGA
jgi:LAO/AO transport system kinase